MFDALVTELSQRYGLGERSRELFGLLMGYIYNDRRGGFDGFIESFRLQGHGPQAASWTTGGAAPPMPLNASDIGMVFGQGLLNDWATRLGVSRATIAAAIAGILPRLVAELAPGRQYAADGDGQRPPPTVDVPPAADLPSCPPHAGAAPTTQLAISSPPVRDLGHVVPGRERAPEVGAPSTAAGGDLPPPHREPAPPPTTDAAERRIADMAAAIGQAGGRHSSRIDGEPGGGGKFDTWRPAIHRPPKRQSRWPYLLVVALLLAAAVAIAWSLGLLETFIVPRLNPLLAPYGLKLPPPPKLL